MLAPLFAQPASPTRHRPAARAHSCHSHACPTHLPTPHPTTRTPVPAPQAMRLPLWVASVLVSVRWWTTSA